MLFRSNEIVSVHGYEIHVGRSRVAPGSTPLLIYGDGSTDGTISGDRQVAGCYLHGLFDAPQALSALMAWLGHSATTPVSYVQQQQDAIERLADCVEQHLDMAKLESLFHSNWRQNHGE